MKKVLLVLLIIILIGPGSAGIIIYNSLIPPAKEAIRGIWPVADTVEHWQSTRETRERGAGDCEDFAFLIAERYEKDGICFRPVIINMGQGPHMVLQVGALYVDSIRPRLIPAGRYEIIKAYDWNKLKRRL